MAAKHPTEISVTSILDYQKDPLRWAFRWVENRVPRYTPRSLTIGKMVHAAFEEHFKTGKPVASAMADLVTIYSANEMDEKEAETFKEMQAMIEPLTFWKDEFPVTRTLEVEEPFEFFVSSGAKFRGRPDRVVEVFGHVYHMQHKTVGKGTKIGDYLTLAQRSLHELIYGRWLALKYGGHRTPNGTPVAGLPYGGTIYNVIRKLQYRGAPRTKEQKATGIGPILHEPSELFLQSVVPIDSNQQTQAIDDVNRISIEMDRAADAYLAGNWPIANRSADRGMYGKYIDPYFPVLMGEAQLSDDSLFMDREDTYEDARKEEIESGQG